MDVKRYMRAQWDRVIGGGCLALGALALLFGWLGVSGTALSYEQVPYLISGGALGVALVGVGATMLLSADLRDEWRKLDRLEDSVRDAIAALNEVGSDPPSANGQTPSRRREPLRAPKRTT